MHRHLFLEIYNTYTQRTHTFIGPNLLENTGKPGDFYSWFGQYLKYELKPKAIVIISAHWQAEGPDKIFGNAL